MSRLELGIADVLRWGFFVGIALALSPVTGSAQSAIAGSVPLIDAVKGGDATTIRTLLTRVDVNATAADGSTALQWAVHRNDVQAVELLLRAGADVRRSNRYGATPLWLASLNGNAAILDLLLSAGADPNTTMAEGDTVLMMAARTGNVGAVRSLLAHGADVNAREGWKAQTALMWAAAENHGAVVRALIEAGADVHARTKYSPYRSAAILTAKTEGGFTAVLFAARGGQIDALKALLAGGANVNETSSDGTSALVIAIASAQYDAAAFLVENGANPNAAEQGWTALHQVAWTNKPNTGLNNPYPLPRGKLDVPALIDVLVKRGANVNALVTKEPEPMYTGRNSMSQIGATPFLLAAKNVDVPLMRVLAAHGADPLLPNQEQTTPLMAAAGVGIWAPAENPGTPEEALEAVKLCLELGGDVTTVDANGDTALHGAALRGANGVVELLVDAGARLDVKNSMRKKGGRDWIGGWTPWRIAEGVYMNAGLKQQSHTSELLRRLMEARGLSAGEIDEAAQANAAGALEPPANTEPPATLKTK